MRVVTSKSAFPVTGDRLLAVLSGLMMVMGTLVRAALSGNRGAAEPVRAPGAKQPNHFSQAHACSAQLERAEHLWKLPHELGGS